MRRTLTVILLASGATAIVAAFVLPPRVGPPVTPLMAGAADAASGRAARAVPGAPSGRPTVVFFIARGCPCSEAYEPYARRLFEAYGGRASFVGVIDGDEQDAEDWRRSHATPFPVAPDPGGELARAYGAERSAYTALVADGATIQRLWPGYSGPMLRELGARLAAASGGDEARLDVTGAPEALTSGCPFAP